MKIRTFFVDVFRFVLLCLVLMILIPLAVHADPCATYQSDYDSKDTAYRAAMDNLLRANVAVEKNTPYGSVPSTYKDLEKEYEKNPGGFLKTLKQGLDVHPNMPTKTGAFIDTALNFINVANIRKARSDAVIALGVAKAAREAAKKALENCKGSPVQIVWCERGASCQTPPGVQGLPRKHYVSDCPDKISGLFGIKRDCPGTWWSCDGTNICPRSSDHVNRTCEEKAWHREPIRIQGEDYIHMYVSKCPQGEYSGATCPNAANHVGSGESVEEKYVDANGNPVDISSIAPNCPWCNRPAVTSTPGPVPSVPHIVTCSTCDGRYFSCDEESIERHQTRTCWRCGVAYTGCTRTRKPVSRRRRAYRRGTPSPMQQSVWRLRHMHLRSCRWEQCR